MNYNLPEVRAVRVGSAVNVMIAHVDGVNDYTVYRDEGGGAFTLLPQPVFDTTVRRWTTSDTTPGRVYRIGFTQAGVLRELWALVAPVPATVVLFGHLSALNAGDLDPALSYVEITAAGSAFASRDVPSVLRGNTVIVNRTVTVQANQDGYWQCVLLAGTTVAVRIPHVGMTRKVVLPSNASSPVNFLDLPVIQAYPHGANG